MFRIRAYIYVLLCVLIYVGIKRCYPRVAKPERAIVFPLLLLVLGVTSLQRLFPMAGFDAYAWAVAALAGGTLLGWLHAGRWALRFETENGATHVHLPGDPSLLLTLLAAFAAVFVMHFAVGSHQPWAATNAFVVGSFGIWGLLAGMPLGRASNVLVRCARASGARATEA